MASVRPLRDLLADLVGDAGARHGGPEAYLAEHGFPDLPPELVAEAVVSFADTAPPEVAEQLAPFVTAHTAGREHAADWFALLTSTPARLADDPDALDGDPEPGPGDDLGPDPGMGLDFGAGAVDAPDLAASPDVELAAPAPATAEEWASAPEQPAPDSADLVAGDVVADEEEDEESLD